MKKLLLISTGFAALIAPIVAAAKPLRRPVPVAAPVYAWTGFYVGGNVGYGWGDARTDIAGNGTSFFTPSFVATEPVLPGTVVAFADSNTARLNGVIGGGQVGYNYQFSPKWVLGFEADIQGAGKQGSNAFLDTFSSRFCTSAVLFTCVGTSPLNGTATTGYDAKIDWFGTVRGRLGLLITDQVLFYGTGGLAYGRVELSGNTTVNGSVVGIPGPPFSGATAFSESKTKAGFAVGGGFEAKLWANWTWKIEYLYLDLGYLDTASPFPAATPLAGGFSSPFTGSITTRTHFTDNIVRVGLNYKFGNN